VRTSDALAAASEVIFSVCPPHAAVELARSLVGFDGIYVDANAVAPATARTISESVGRYVDGGMIGPPPLKQGTTRLYLSGPDAELVADLFAASIVEAIVVSDGVASASALKMAYAAWSKGTFALLLAICAVARAEGVEDALFAEWSRSLVQLPDQTAVAANSALTKGWRWIGEMMEIAETFSSADLPRGFHEAAAEIYRRVPRDAPGDDALERVVATILANEPTGSAVV
jgi:hypothetical protein